MITNQTMKREKNIIRGCLIAILLSFIMGSASSCSDDGPSAPRLYSEADSLALCKIMAEAPVLYEFQYKWDPKRIKSLPPDWNVVWRMCDDGQYHIVTMVVCAYDYRVAGRISEAFADLECLETVAIMGPGWEGQLPDDFGQNITGLALKETSLTSIDCKMNLGGIWQLFVQDNPLLTTLPDLSTLGRDLNYSQQFNVVISGNENLSGQVPTINIQNKSWYCIQIVDNGYTSVDYQQIGGYRCRWGTANHIEMSNNKISGTLPDYITNDPQRLVRAYYILNPQSEGFGISNMPSDEEIARLKKGLDLPEWEY